MAAKGMENSHWPGLDPVPTPGEQSNGEVASHEEITVSDKGRENGSHITLWLIMQSPYNLVVTWKEA